jgi:hypothetical protein
MAYNTQHYWVFGFYLSTSILQIIDNWSVHALSQLLLHIFLLSPSISPGFRYLCVCNNNDMGHPEAQNRKGV